MSVRWEPILCVVRPTPESQTQVTLASRCSLVPQGCVDLTAHLIMVQIPWAVTLTLSFLPQHTSGGVGTSEDTVVWSMRHQWPGSTSPSWTRLLLGWWGVCHQGMRLTRIYKESQMRHVGVEPAFQNSMKQYICTYYLWGYFSLTLKLQEEHLCQTRVLMYSVGLPVYNIVFLVSCVEENICYVQGQTDHSVYWCNINSKEHIDQKLYRLSLDAHIFQRQFSDY